MIQRMFIHCFPKPFVFSSVKTITTEDLMQYVSKYANAASKDMKSISVDLLRLVKAIEQKELHFDESALLLYQVLQHIDKLQLKKPIHSKISFILNQCVADIERLLYCACDVYLMDLLGKKSDAFNSPELITLVNVLLLMAEKKQHLTVSRAAAHWLIRLQRHGFLEGAIDKMTEKSIDFAQWRRKDWIDDFIPGKVGKYNCGFFSIETMIQLQDGLQQEVKLSQLLKKMRWECKWPSLLVGERSSYLVSPTITTGSFGKFRIGFSRQEGQFYGVKELRLSNPACTPKKTEVSLAGNYVEEVGLMAKIRQGVGSVDTITTSKSLFIVSPLMAGSLVSLIIAQHAKTIHKSLGWYTLLATGIGLEELHSLNYMHLDVKLDNLLFDKQGQIRLADFGLSMSIEDYQEKNDCRGSLPFMPLEIMDKNAMGFSADIWSLALTIGTMVNQKKPPILFRYNKMNLSSLQELRQSYLNWYIKVERARASNTSLPWAKVLEVTAAPAFRSFAVWMGLWAGQEERLADFAWRRMLRPDPQERATTTEIIAFCRQQEQAIPFINEAQEILQAHAKLADKVELKYALQAMHALLPIDP